MEDRGPSLSPVEAASRAVKACVKNVSLEKNPVIKLLKFAEQRLNLDSVEHVL